MSSAMTETAATPVEAPAGTSSNETDPRPGAPLRVLCVANWAWEADPLPWAEQRVAALREAGAEVDVLAVDCQTDRAGFLRLAAALDRRLRARRYDVVAPLYGSVLALVCAMQRRAPCVVSFAGSDLNGTFDARGRLRPASLPSMAASQLAAALAAGVSVRNERMRASLWTGRARAAIIPSGVDTARFQPMPRAEARRLRGLPETGTRFAFVAIHATRRPGKRLDLARAAVELVPGAALDVIEGVPHTEMRAAYAAADALLFTSAMEGSPNCVKEALACGVPVVSVDVGDVREVLAGLPNCAVVEATPGALARALLEVIEDGRGCVEGPGRIQERYSLKAMAERFIRLYTGIG